MKKQKIRTKSDNGDELVGYFDKKSVLYFRRSKLAGYKLYRLAKAIVNRYEHSRTPN